MQSLLGWVGGIKIVTGRVLSVGFREALARRGEPLLRKEPAEPGWLQRAVEQSEGRRGWAWRW